LDLWDCPVGVRTPHGEPRQVAAAEPLGRHAISSLTKSIRLALDGQHNSAHSCEVRPSYPGFNRPKIINPEGVADATSFPTSHLFPLPSFAPIRVIRVQPLPLPLDFTSHEEILGERI